MTQTTSESAPVYDVETVSKALVFAHYRVGDAVVFGPSPTALPGYITFFDPGWSILHLRQAVADKLIFSWQGWYQSEPFAKLEESPRYRQLQMEPMKDSFRKPFVEQQALVPPDMEIPAARVVLMGVVIHYLATGERLFPDYWVRCVDEVLGGSFVLVGRFGSGGLRVDCEYDKLCGSSLGLACSRKF